MANKIAEAKAEGFGEYAINNYILSKGYAEPTATSGAISTIPELVDKVKNDGNLSFKELIDDIIETNPDLSQKYAEKISSIGAFSSGINEIKGFIGDLPKSFKDVKGLKKTYDKIADRSKGNNGLDVTKPKELQVFMLKLKNFSETSNDNGSIEYAKAYDDLRGAAYALGDENIIKVVDDYMGDNLDKGNNEINKIFATQLTIQLYSQSQLSNQKRYKKEQAKILVQDAIINALNKKYAETYDDNYKIDYWIKDSTVYHEKESCVLGIFPCSLVITEKEFDEVYVANNEIEDIDNKNINKYGHSEYYTKVEEAIRIEEKRIAEDPNYLTKEQYKTLLLDCYYGQECFKRKIKEKQEERRKKMGLYTEEEKKQIRTNKINERIARIREAKDLEKRQEQLYYKRKIAELEANKNKVTVNDYNDTLTPTDSKNHNFQTVEINQKPKTTDWIASKNKIIEAHKKKNQEVVTDKVKKKAKSKDFHRNPDDIKNDLKGLFAENIRLRDEYKKAKLDKEKSIWNDLYTRKYSDAELAQLKAEFEENAIRINNVRRSSNIDDYEPYVPNGRAVNNYVKDNLDQYKSDNANQLAVKKAELEKSLASTKSNVDNFTLEYQKAFKEVKKVNDALQKANFKPTKDKEAEIKRLTEVINKKKAEAEKARNQANDYIEKQIREEKALAYAEIDKHHYDAVAGSYKNAKNDLDSNYANDLKLIDKKALDTNYKEVMAILEQPIVEEPEKPKVVSGKYRGFYSSISNDDEEHFGYDYAELAEGSSLTSDSKIITRFGNKGVGMKNDTLTTGSGNHLGGYKYVGLGKWNSPNNQYIHTTDRDNTLETHNVDRGYWVFGKPTKELPKTGEAGFIGEVNGYAKRDNNTSKLDELEGNIGLKVDFNTKNVAGKMSINYADTGNSFANIKFSSAKIDLTQQAKDYKDLKDKNFSSYFNADEFVSDDNTQLYDGDVVGAFYGSNTSEVGGGWKIQNSNGNASGVFRAKQTTESNDLIPDDPNEVLEIPKDDQNTNNSNNNNDNSTNQDYGEVSEEDPFYIEPNPSVSNGDSQYTHNYNLQNIDNSDYNYVKWGQWNDSGNDVYNVSFESGTTPSADIPKIGQATYSGDVRGDYRNDNTKIYNHDDITGNINFTADFEDNTVRGKLHTARISNGQTFANAKFYVRLNGGEFNGKVSNTNDTKGSVSGRFYGSNAQEAFGGFALEKSSEGERVIGNFRAKKQ